MGKVCIACGPAATEPEEEKKPAGCEGCPAGGSCPGCGGAEEPPKKDEDKKK